MTEVRGTPNGRGRRVAIVAARFNESITSALVEGAVTGLTHYGVNPEDIDTVWVPGAFEIPAVAKLLATGGQHDAIVALGAVIRGETAHFDLVAGEAARGIAEVSRDTGIPVIFEILATEDLSQARARAGGAGGNKGWEAAEAALEMIDVLVRLAALVDVRP